VRAPAFIDHLTLPVRDLAASRTFYETALEPFGVRVVESEVGIGFGPKGAEDFYIAQGEPPPDPLHLAFAAPERGMVDAFHAAAVAAGGRDNGEPGPRPKYHEHYYAAYVIDPDGHNVEAVCHEAPDEAGVSGASS
jgi:catechol 2,3-dioxygenase-like lactoylglutathione lyase family enzyme